MKAGKVCALMLLGVSGCQNHPVVLQPALAQTLSTEGVGEIVQAIAAETGMDKIRVSAAAFARSHILVLNNAPRRSIQHGVIDARDAVPPLRFHLLSDGRRCFLRSEQSGNRVALSNVRCSLVDP